MLPPVKPAMPAADPAILTPDSQSVTFYCFPAWIFELIGGLKREFREIYYWLATPVSLVTKILKYNCVIAFLR